MFFLAVLAAGEVSHSRHQTSAPIESRIIPSFVGLDDPERWSVDRETGFRFRRATQLELDRNRWDPGTFLVETGRLLPEAQRGAKKLKILIPLSDSSSHLVQFKLAGSLQGLTVIETRVVGSGGGAAAQASASQPQFFRYHTNTRSTRSGGGVGGAVMLLSSSDNGGLSARGVVEAVDTKVLGPSSVWFLEDVPASGRPIRSSELAKVSLLAAPGSVQAAWTGCDTIAIAECDLICAYLGGEPCEPFDDEPPLGLECVDMEDNDGDGFTDSSDFNCAGQFPDVHAHEAGAALHFHRFESGRDFGLFAEGNACTSWSDSWDEELWDISGAVDGALREENQPLGEDIRPAVISCWIFGSIEAAQACDASGDCAPFDAKPHLYPYPGANGDNGAYRAGGRSDLWHYGYVTANHGAPLAVVDVLHAGIITVNDQGKCGNAFQGAGNPLSGFSVSSVLWGACPPEWKNTVHEIGHLMGADHDVWPEDPPHTFMTDGDANSYLPFFSPANAQLVNACLGNYYCPRGGDLGSEPPDP